MSTNRATDAGYAFDGYNIYVNIDVADFVNWMNTIRSTPSPTISRTRSYNFEYTDQTTQKCSVMG